MSAIRNRPSRRDFLRVGSLSALGLGLPGFFALRACGAGAVAAKAKSCILIWLDGGPSHLETFDPKPGAPAEVRGPFSVAKTNVLGIEICDLFSRLNRRL